MTRPRLIALIRFWTLWGACLIVALCWRLYVEAAMIPVMLIMPVFQTCTIFSDDFATDRTGADYTTVSGTPTVSGGVLTTTSTGFLIVENTSGTTGHGRTSISINIDTTAGKAGVVGSYVDSSNYLFLEVTINGTSSTGKLWKRVSGIDTQLGSTMTFSGSTATTYSIEVCWDGTTATGSIGSTRVASGSFTGTGNQSGFRASPNGGTVTFNNFLFEKHHSDDATCTACSAGVNCLVCDSGYTGGFEVNVSGVVNHGGY